MDWSLYLRAVLAFIFVLGLIGAVALAARRLPGVGLKGPLGRRRRLSISEVLPLDGRRRVLLIKRDGVEHLVLTGGAGGDLLLEAGIGPLAGPDNAENAR